MFAKVFYRTVRHYSVTILALLLIYLIFVWHLKVDNTLAYLLMILTSWLQPVSEKAREFKQQIALEEVSRLPALSITRRREPPRETGPSVGLRTLLRAVFVLGGILVLLALASYGYLFARLRGWL